MRRHLLRQALASGAIALCLAAAALPASAAGIGTTAGAGTTAAATADAADEASGQCTAQTRITDSPPAFGVLQVQAAWRVTRGAGVTVAVVDSGVAASNPHLAGAMTGGTDLVHDKADKQGRSDHYGHGTAIAGQIGARAIEGSGAIGLAPEAKIMSVRVYAGTEDRTVDAGNGPDVARLAKGIEYAAAHGAQVINVSLSTARPDARLQDAVAYAAEHGSLVVSSAGNRDQSASIAGSDADGPRFPAAYRGAIGVAATGDAGTVTGESIHGPHVALAAPGQNILSISTAGGDCIFSSDAPATSYAAAYVSAAAALVAAAHPDETPAQWAYRLEATARRANPDVRDDVSGWGVIQPYSALTLAPGPGIRGPDSPFPAAGQPATPAVTPAPVVVRDLPPAHAGAWAIGSVVGVLALGALATIGTLIVLRRRGDSEAESPLAGRGLYGQDEDADAGEDHSAPGAGGAASGRRQA